MFMSPVYAFLFYTALILGVIPLLLVIFNYSKFKKKRNPILPYLIVVFVASFYEYFGTHLLEINSTNWLITYKVLAISSLQYFFYHILQKKFKLLFIAFSIIFIVTFIYHLPYLNNTTVLDISAYLNAITTSLVLTFSVLRFIQFETKTVEYYTKRDTNFYFIMGLVLMYGGTLFLFLYAKNLYFTNKELFITAWMLNLFLNIVNRTLLIIGVWKLIKLNKNN
jgi:hypothetical protein